MTDVRVREARTGSDLRRFVALPYRLHRRDPAWTPALRRDVRHRLSRKNPFFQHGDAAYFLAERDGKVVGRVAAIENRAHNETHDDRVGFFGFFEVAEDREAAAALLERAGDWLRQRGFESARGPVSFSTNDECGILVDGFDTPPTLLTPHNPPYYSRLLEEAGFRKAKDLFLHERLVTELPERLLRSAKAIARRQDVHLRAMDKRRFDDEIEHVKRLYNAAWEKNWGFVPMTEAEIDELARELRPIVEPELVVFVEHQGAVVGFGVALPDLAVALRANRSGRLVPGILRVLWAARKIDRVRVLLLGVEPEFRGKGVDSLLIQWIWQKARDLGIRWGEAGWVLEDNGPMNNAMQRAGFDHYRTLRLYEREL